MADQAHRREPALGFLTVIEQPEQGWFGGYLILNANGRPLEFHCTAPVRPSRAQEILYGPTLKPYVFGEQIGRTLVHKGRVTPLVVCTDVEPMLALRESIETPVVLVGTTADADAGFDGVEFPLHQAVVRVRSAWSADRETLTQWWSTAGCTLDLREPFERIRGAIDEARKAAAA